MTEQYVLSLIRGWQQQDKQAMQILMDISYQQLHMLSHQQRSKLPDDASTELLNQSATDIAHDLFLKFQQARPQMSINTVREFYQYLNASVRNLYVDQYRRFNQSNRAEMLTQLFSTRAMAQTDELMEHQLDFADLDELLQHFRDCYSRQAEVLELKFFARQSNKEIARLIDVSVRTVENDIRFAKAWFKSKLK